MNIECDEVENANDDINTQVSRKFPMLMSPGCTFSNSRLAAYKGSINWKSKQGHHSGKNSYRANMTFWNMSSAKKLPGVKLNIVFCYRQMYKRIK